MTKQSNGTVFKVHKSTDFTIMSNHHLRNLNLSLKAVGLMSKLLSLPDDWSYSIAGLVKICREGKTAVRAALQELIDEKYVYIEKIPPNYTKSGRFEYVYHIYELPYEDIPNNLEYPEPLDKSKQDTENPDVENPGLENPGLENPGLENQPQLNTKESNTKESNTKYIYTPAQNLRKSKAESKRSYAEAVSMTETEYRRLTEKHTQPFVDKCIEVLDNYKQSSGKKYKSDYHAILNWVVEKVAKDSPSLDKPVNNAVYDINVNPFDIFLKE
ncbi:MAG: hypothetical protein LUI05_04255 [Oscillospiraceae bacterium]|nr:hypothetical protein [Oscillospiraceae bacterium]